MQTIAKPLSHVTKLAEVGGDGNEDNFELAFSNLAHAFNHQASPSLEPNELGFQLLERSDDGKRAAGITGFKVGNQLLYAPIFWLKGKIKGHELMFLHDHDMFVPNKENWINEMLQQRMPRIGDPVNRNPRQLGIRHPDLQRMSRSPYKTACEQVQHREDLLLEFIREAGPAGVKAFKELADHAPAIAKAAHELHGDALLGALTDAAHSLPSIKLAAAPMLANPKRQPGVRLFFAHLDLTGDHSPELSDDEREKLTRDGAVIRDDRKDADVSMAYDEETTSRLFNPTTTGLYDVLMATGEPKRCLVLLHPRRLSFGNSGVVVVSLEGEHQTFTGNINEVWATTAHTQTDFVDFVRGLPSVSSLGGDSRIVILTEDGSGTVPLGIRKVTEEIGSSTHYEISYGGDRLVVDGIGTTRIRCLDDKIFVPATARRLSVDDDYGPRLRLGRASDLRSALDRSFAKLAVFRSGAEVVLANAGGQSASMSPLDGLVQLVTHHGLRESAARELLKRADQHRKAGCFVKYAEPYLRDVRMFGPAFDLQDMQGTHQMRSGDSVAEQIVERVKSRVDMPREPDRYQSEVNYVDGGMDIAQQAAQTGQKDVFDASVLTTMLRNMRDDQLIDRFIPPLVRAMDATGRMLFQFYWHQEDFAERYGDRDMPELEDALRNQFEGLGDLVLKLKQKSVNPELGPGELGVSLHDLAGAS